MPRKNILTFDVGTTSVKTCIFDENLNIMGFSSEEYELIAKDGGIIELEPEKYWHSIKRGLAKACLNGNINLGDIHVISITTQGETLIPVDAVGNPLRNAIVWLDGRALAQSGVINEKYPPQDFYAATGIPECTEICPISKLVWIKENEPEIYEACHKFMLLEDYIIMKLTGKFVTEKSLMCTTGYFDIVKDCLWNEMLDFAGIDKNKIPEILECGTIVGSVTPAAAAELGLGEGVLVSTAAMDQVAGAVGSGNISRGVVTETHGTALGIAVTTETPDFSHKARITIYRHIWKGKYLIIPICMTAGIVLKWFKDEFCESEALRAERERRDVYDILGDMAEQTPPLAGGLTLIPHFTGVMQPDKNLKAKGVFFGVGLETKKPHFVRAIFESVAYLLRENLELIEEVTGDKIGEIRALGGGAKSLVWRKIKADVTGKRIVCMEKSECTSLGAAILGGLAAGLFCDVKNAIASANRTASSVEPDMALREQYEKGYSKYKNLYAAIRDLFE